MEADGAPLTPLPLSLLRFTGIQRYGYTDQRKVEADVEVTEGRTGDLSLRKPGTSQLSRDCFCKFDSTIMQNMSHNLRLFCAPTWPSYHVIENHLYNRSLFLRRLVKLS